MVLAVVFLLVLAPAAHADSADANATAKTTNVSPTPPDKSFDLSPPPSPRLMGPPDVSYSYAGRHEYPSFAWIAAQLVPSPELAFGRVQRIGIDGHAENESIVTFGFRWQVTPILWSWGTHRAISPWRFVVVDPLARHAGSIETDLAIEYLGGDADRLLLRPGVHATFPIVQRGESLSASLGTSVYWYDGTARMAYTVGTYFLSGLFGVELTFSPVQQPLRTIATFRIRYF
ncbi:MAG: hypothetical protein FWD73_00830 [Polyangiaceae bacterium]|nr:hypothetical protein [Polyangiaceae bacterium]